MSNPPPQQQSQTPDTYTHKQNTTNPELVTLVVVEHELMLYQQILVVRQLELL